MRGTTKLATVAVATVALALTGCAGKAADNGGGGSNGPADAFALMASDVTGSMQKVAGVSKKTKSMRMSMEIKAAGETVTGTGAMAFGDPLKVDMTLDTPEGKIGVRMIGTVEYVQIPAKERGSLNGKKWMKIDLADLGKAAGAGDLVKQMQDMDPGKQVRVLLAGGTIKAVGEETIDGVRTVHYSGTAPLEKYLGELAPKLREQTKKELAKQGATEVTMDVWADENYQPRRVRSVTGTTQTTVTYSDFGAPVTVKAPPASETIEFGDMLAGLGGN